MFMRFCGLGPGHKVTRAMTKVFRDEVKSTFGLAYSDQNQATSLDAGGEDVVQRDVEGDPEDELDGDDDDDSEGEGAIGAKGIALDDELEYAPL